MRVKAYIIWITLILTTTWRLLHAQEHYEVTRLSFNTKSKELAPAFFQTGLVFCSDRRNDVLVSYTDLDNNPLTNLYQVDQHKPGKFGNPRLMAKELTTFMFEGPAVFSKDGKTIYFTRTINVSSGRKNQNRLDTTYGIFSAELIDGVWKNLTQFNFNNEAYNTGYPCLSDDGKQLFFCSDAPGGYGGLDIYVCHLENGRWGKPENLGDEINTSENEVFPFLHPNGRLFFASRGHKQRTDLDIYFTVFVNGNWQKPVPLTGPFNTTNDDYGLILNATADTGYFVSDRAGSADIFAAYSSLPVFSNCPPQQKDEFCYVFYEPNNNELDTTTFVYEWDMGDGTLIRQLEADHCFAQAGKYLVQLNIVDKLTGDVLLSQATYEFVAEKTKQPYILAPDTVTVGQEFSLNGTESNLENFTIDQYYWDFGDGFKDTGMETKHRFLFPGTYTLKLGLLGNSNDAPDDAPASYCISRKIVVLSNGHQ